MKRVVIKSIAVILLFLCVTGTWFVLEMLIPHRTMYDSGQFNLEDDYRMRKKVRNACHKVLSYPIGNYYDAFWTLDEVGNKGSIPYLIRALKSLHQWPLKDMNLDRSILSCIGSLQIFTGMDFGDDYEKWENWWKETGHHLPFDEEKRQLVLPEGTE